MVVSGVRSALHPAAGGRLQSDVFGALPFQ